MTDRTEKLIQAGIARNADAQTLSMFEAVAVKSEGVQLRSAEPEAQLEVVNERDRQIRYVWSTETVDRAGDIVRQNWDLGPFTANPIALYNHDHDVVLGRALDFGVELGKRKALVGTIEYAPEGTDPLIDSRFKLAASGILRTTSVGFLPLQVDPVRDVEERAALGLGDWGVVFERNQLLEISVVTVPMNPDAQEAALLEAVQRSVITADEAEYVANDTAPTERDLFGALDRLGRAVEPAAAEARDVALIDVAAVFARLDEMEERFARDTATFQRLSAALMAHATRTIRSSGDAVDTDGSGRERIADGLSEFARRVTDTVGKTRNG